MFAQTEHLTLRAYRDTDLLLLLALWNDPRVQQTGTMDFVRPHTTSWAAETLTPQIERALFAGVLEVRAASPDADDAQRFVGYVLLQADTVTFARTKDASLAIALEPRWSVRMHRTEIQYSPQIMQVGPRIWHRSRPLDRWPWIQTARLASNQSRRAGPQRACYSAVQDSVSPRISTAFASRLTIQ
jgi:hypothetical protein